MKHCCLTLNAPAIAIAACMALLPLSRLSAQKSSSTNVTTVVYDADTSGYQLLLRSDDHGTSGQATYTTTTSRNSSLYSWIVNNGTDWNLNLMGQSLRTLFITPDDPVGTQASAPPANFYWQGVQATSHCFVASGVLVTLASITTSSASCSLGVNFVYSGTTYKLLMSPYPFSESGDTQPICPSGGCPATGTVTVTCNAVNNSQCTNWTISPSSSTAAVANLYYLSQSKKGSPGTWRYVGQYYNTFLINVNNP